MTITHHTLELVRARIVELNPQAHLGVVRHLEAERLLRGQGRAEELSRDTVAVARGLECYELCAC